MGSKKKILAIGAHPDDIEIGCGGSLALAQRQGHEIYNLILTDGEAGSQKISKQDLSIKRKQEAINAAQMLGIQNVDFLGFEDGLTHVERPMKIQLIDKIRSIKPQVVFIHSSWDQQWDHSLFHHLCRKSVDAAKGPWFQETKEAPHSVETVLGFEVWHPIPDPNLVVDISSVMDLKIKALKEHVSQVSSVAYDQAFQGLARYRGVMTHTGTYGEAFEVITTSTETNFTSLFR